MALYIIIAAIIALAAIVIFTPLRIKLEVSFVGAKNKLFLEWHILFVHLEFWFTIRRTGAGIAIYRIKDGELKELTLKFVKSGTKAKARNVLLNYLRFDSAEAEVEAGTGDAASTALLCGFIMTVINSLFAVLNFVKRAKTRVKVQPVFSGERFLLKLRCITHFAVVHIISDKISAIRRRRCKHGSASN